jgi:hypothetical protein
MERRKPPRRRLLTAAIILSGDGPSEPARRDAPGALAPGQTGLS